MSTLKDIAKNGWHPKSKDIGDLKDKWIGDIKVLNQKGWMGKGRCKDSNEQRAPRPLQSLIDPATFRPPPRKIQYDGDDETSPDLRKSERHYNIDSLSGNDNAKERILKSNPPPIPHRASNQKIRSPLSTLPRYSEIPAFENTESSAPAFEKSILPPRLPPRDSSISTQQNQRMIETKLPKCVSTKGFSNILEAGEGTNGGCGSSVKPPSPTKNGTTFSQKKEAVKTISSFSRNPSSVAISDIKKAVFTANNFRERHDNQVKSGLILANKFSSQNGISEKVRQLQIPLDAANQLNGGMKSEDLDRTNINKKRPPPPPPKLMKNLDLIGPSIELKKKNTTPRDY